MSKKPLFIVPSLFVPIALVLLVLFLVYLPQLKQTPVSTPTIPLTGTTTDGLLLYTGSIPHIFFHSLMVYPEKAAADPYRSELFAKNMISVDQFKTILQKLYDNHFVLIDSRLLYAKDTHGNMYRPALYIPRDKKPLVLSLDDLNYYQSMKNDGQANKLVIKDGKIATQVLMHDGSQAITTDGDVVPILESFIAAHPDFSFNGARGIIALTGFDGILGYRTQSKNPSHLAERTKVLPVIFLLKKTGWIFASHSYSHDQIFINKTITPSELAIDIGSWQSEVEPLVGLTPIFIGPFGQTFSPDDSRRNEIINSGFTVLYGVGIDGYTKYFDHYVFMDRIDIDGYRLANDAYFLSRMLGI